MVPAARTKALARTPKDAGLGLVADAGQRDPATGAEGVVAACRSPGRSRAAYGGLHALALDAVVAPRCRSCRCSLNCVAVAAVDGELGNTAPGWCRGRTAVEARHRDDGVHAGRHVHRGLRRVPAPVESRLGLRGRRTPTKVRFLMSGPPTGPADPVEPDAVVLAHRSRRSRSRRCPRTGSRRSGS